MENTFEGNLKELEQVVSTLEKGELPLDEAIKTFEKGIELSKNCKKTLDEAEKKINVLVEKNGELSEGEFDVN